MLPSVTTRDQMEGWKYKDDKGSKKEKDFPREENDSYRLETVVGFGIIGTPNTIFLHPSG